LRISFPPETQVSRLACGDPAWAETERPPGGLSPQGAVLLPVVRPRPRSTL
jgi:hypothetical protein